MGVEGLGLSVIGGAGGERKRVRVKKKKEDFMSCFLLFLPLSWECLRERGKICAV